MEYPPFGYDDETLVPSIKAKQFLQTLLQKLMILENKFTYLPQKVIKEMNMILEDLVKSTEELPYVFRMLSLEIFEDMQNFFSNPSKQALEKITAKANEFSALFQD